MGFPRAYVPDLHRSGDAATRPGQTVPGLTARVAGRPGDVVLLEYRRHATPRPTAPCHYREMPGSARKGSPCDGTLGKDAEALTRARGSLAGIRADLATAYVPLRGRDFRGADLSTADLTGQLFFRRYVFRCASLRHATLRRICFIRCDFSWADLTSATLHGASLSACDLTNVDAQHADLRYVQFNVASDAAGWRGCDLSGANFDGADLRGATFHANTIWPEGFDPILAGASPDES